MALPDNWLPEGIATVGSTAYLGSRADGDILRLDLRTGEYEVFSQGPGHPGGRRRRPRDGLLLVAGGTTGSGRVVDQRSGATLATFSFTTGPSFVNDVVLTERDRVVHRLPAAAALRRVAPRRLRHHAATVRSDGCRTPGVNNANGIETTPDRSALLVINSSNGTLYRVDPETGAATAVDTGGVVADQR